jgi:DNA repair protein RadC
MKQKKDEYPIQKCLSGQDIKSLSDSELLSILLGSGTKGLSVFEVADNMLKMHGCIARFQNMGIREIAKAEGIGPGKAVRILASIEFGRRSLTDAKSKEHLPMPSSVWEMLRAEVSGIEHEMFFSLVLDGKNRLLKKVIVSVGTIMETMVHPREVFRDAIRECGAAVIVAHNHPSGDVTPSKQDISSTMRLSEAGSIIGINLLDHVILSSSLFFSMKEGGYL